jgi:hypothetical protein
LTAGEYFGELTDGLLPKQINFITSAYYTGVDIFENYHSIAVSSYQAPHTLLSNHKLKQIIGRCRKKLLSETVIYSTKRSNEVLEEYDINVYIMENLTTSFRAKQTRAMC